MGNVIDGTGYFKYKSLSAMPDRYLCMARYHLNNGSTFKWRNFEYTSEDIFAVEEIMRNKMYQEMEKNK